MEKYFMIPDYMICVLSVLFFIIIAEGIFICKILKCKKTELKNENSLERKIERYRDFWGEFVLYVLATSIVGIFIVSLVKKENITLADINNWVGIILGFVALIVGIISLWLSFYNVDQANRSQEEIKKTAEEIKTSVLGWQKTEEGDWNFFCRDGSLARCEWKKSGDDWYYLDENGKLEKDSFVFEDNGKTIYYVDAEGKMVRETWVEYEGTKRYMTENGEAFMDGKLEVDGKTYNFKHGFLDE